MMGHIAWICLLVGCASSEVTLSTSSQESRATFALMVRDAIGFHQGLSLVGYGCYCGADSDVGLLPVDATDSCCMAHDHAWSDAGDVAPSCDCNTQDYTYANTGGTITCTAGQGACASYCCEADRAFAQCVQGSPPGQHTNYDRSQCEPIECAEDDDCDHGLWCDEGRCVPYCGSDGAISSSVETCDTVEEAAAF